MRTDWNEVKKIIRAEVPEHSYKIWLDPVELVEVINDYVVLSCPNSFSRKRVVEQYGRLFKSTINKVMGQHLSIQFVVTTNVSKVVKNEFSIEQMNFPQMDIKFNYVRKLRADFTFDQFVVGESNNFAYSAALSIATGENSSNNSLLLLSKTGLGKSHLSQAAGHHVLLKFPQKRVYYITAEDFTNEMINAYRNNNRGEFKNKYRKGCDVLLMEDIHYLSGKSGTQNELINTLDYLMDSNKKIIYSSPYPPFDVPQLSDKLKSRFCCGLVSNIEPPDYLTRVKILRRKTKISGCVLPNDVIQYLAEELTTDVRQLESGFVGVAAKVSLLGVPADLNLAEEIVKNILTHRANITIRLIKKVICKYNGITVEDLVSKSRKRNVVQLRHVAMYLARRYTNHSLQTIGKSFNRYHATVLHAMKSVEKNLKKNSPVRRQIEFLSESLESGRF